MSSDHDDVWLADGRSVPYAAIKALDDLDRVWPGATLPQARPAIAAEVAEALRRSQP